MKLRDRISYIVANINRHDITNLFRRKMGKKELPTMMIPGQNSNFGPVGSGKSKTFKRNRRATAKRVTYRKALKARGYAANRF